MYYFKKFTPEISAAFVGLSGCIAIIRIPIQAFPSDLYQWLPFNPDHIAYLTTIMIGSSLIYLASQLRRRKVSAFLLTVFVLAILVAFEIANQHHPYLTLSYCVSIAALLSQRKEYVVRNDLTSLRRNTFVSIALLLAVFVFGVVTFERIDQSEFGRELKTSQTIQITANAIVGEELPAFVHPTDKDRALVFGLQSASVISLLILFIGLFYPIRMRKFSSSFSRRRAETILKRYSTSSEDYLKLWPHDKHYFFYKDSFLAYGVSRGVAVVLDGAVGDPTSFDDLRSSFIRECHINGWKLSIIHADTAEKLAWNDFGYTGLYLGSEARVNIAEFCNNKLKDKHFRYVKNKSLKDDLRVVELKQPLSDEIIEQLSIVSDQWLASGRREYRFVMGYFDKQYLRQCRVFALYSNDNILAYTNLLPTFQSQNASIDHMRYTNNLPSTGMHFLLMNVIMSLQDSTYKTLNLGLAPLSKIDDNARNLSKNLLNIMRSLGSRYYSFAGLEQFKNKFEPTWEPTYLLYTGSPSKLAGIGIAGASLTSYRPNRNFKRILILMTLISGLSYAAFPLATVLNPQYAWNGVVSHLGQAGQPFAWVFNAMDAISGLVGIFLVILLLFRLKKLTKILRYSLLSLLFSNIGIVLASIFRLPSGFRIDERISWSNFSELNFVLHFLASLINISGFIIALVLWGLWSYRTFGKLWRSKFTISLLVLILLNATIGQFSLSVGSITQRLVVLSYATWLLIFINDISKLNYRVGRQ